jgi:hypothetical protein
VLPAQNIINNACYIARAPGYAQTIAVDELNALLKHIAQTVDFSAARGQFNFTFNTNLVSSGAGNIITASPNPLPIDYLRVPVSTGSTGAQRSSKWYIQGVPYDMVEIDLTEWDDQVQQAGIQSYPYFWAKDMALRQLIAGTTGDLSSSSQLVNNVASVAGLTAGMSIAGGIGPRSAVVPGTTILTVTPGSPNTLTLSAAPTATLAGASLMIGNPPVAYPYPPPSGAYPVMLRYQRLMPDLTQTQIAAGAFCWFDDDQVLIDGLAGRLMGYSADGRMGDYIGGGLGSGGGLFGKGLAKYTRLADDNANRSRNVELDRRTFGRSFSALKNTKAVGW